MDKKYKILAIFGKSAAGKDSLAKMLYTNISPANRIVSCTTRPKRDYEIEGVDYYFISSHNFEKKIWDNEMLETTYFNNWYYGTPISALDENKINIGVFNVRGIKSILSDNRLDVFPVYLNCDGKTRLLRSLSREANPDCYEICRRYTADDFDFYEIDMKTFPYSYISLNSNNKTTIDDTLAELMHHPDFKEWLYK